MDLSFVASISISDIQRWMETYRGFGPAIAFLLPFIEAFFPVLPLFAIVTGNAAVFGLWPGFLFTWLGACSGSLVTFYLVRKVGSRWSQKALTKYKTLKTSSIWLERHGFSVLFILRCLPFSPSSLINVLAGLSSIPFSTYLWATVLGKAVMIFMLSFIGHDIPEMLREPWKLLFAGVFIFVLWFAGKRLERKYLIKT